MRKVQIVVEEYYHIFNRGVGKKTIFHDKNDYCRFLFLILYFQSSLVFVQLGRLVKHFVRSLASDTGYEEEIVKGRFVELTAFCIMPNHFHLILKELEENGISLYMHRVLTSYAKYYNLKYETSGHVFQGPFQAVHIEDDRQLLYLSTYIHKNPREISEWRNRESGYPWSSYQDFIEENRWRDLLLPDIILEQFKTKDKYKKFVQTSTAKLLSEKVGDLMS